MLQQVNCFMDFYIGAYGKTIRICTSSKESLMDIQNIFTRLKDGVVNEFSFRSSENVQITVMDDLIIRPSQHNKYTAHTIQKSKQTWKGLVFIWTLTQDNIEDCEGLIEGLIENGESGHQYLTKESDGVLVEIAFKG